MIENLDNNAFENQFGRHPPIDGRKSRWRFAGPCANGFNLIAGPYDGNRKGWLSRAAARAHVSYRQIRALWYGETSDPKFSVANSVLGAGAKARLEMERVRYASAAEYLRSHSERLANVDPEFHREEIERSRRAADFISRVD